MIELIADEIHHQLRALDDKIAQIRNIVSDPALEEIIIPNADEFNSYKSELHDMMENLQKQQAEEGGLVRDELNTRVKMLSEMMESMKVKVAYENLEDLTDLVCLDKILMCG